MKYAVLISLLFSTPALALIKGKPLLGFPDVVRLVFTNGWMCTGTFIDPYTILTAAHCLVPEPKEQPLHLSQILSADDKVLLVEEKALIPHPKFSHQWWRSYDVGIIKTSQNGDFKKEFVLEEKSPSITGSAILMGCGKTDLNSNVRSRSTGENDYFRIGSVLFMLGKSSIIAPNDSGGPLIDKTTKHVLAVLTTTTAKEAERYHLPALGSATSVTSEETFKFIQAHLGEMQQQRRERLPCISSDIPYDYSKF